MIEKPIIPSYWPQQSPINIRSEMTLRSTFGVDYLAIQYPEVFEGEFTECDLETGECQFKPTGGAVANISFDNQICPLVKLHFHSPSEHKIDGQSYPLEVHFVHKVPDPQKGSELVVIGAFLKKGAKAPSPAGVKSFGQYLTNLSSNKKKTKIEPAVEFHPYHFLPQKSKAGDYAFYRYEGGLTTPPYSETVSWIVMRDPVEVSPTDLEKIVKKSDHPARETQQASRRFVLRNFD